MDFDYEGAEDYGGRILWGRIAVFGAALLLALILGRCTAGGGVDPAEFQEVQASLSEAQDALAERDLLITDLQQQLVTVQSSPQAGPTGTGGTAGTDDTADAGGAAQTDAEGNQIYVVQPGDTLSTIAETVYGDPLAFGPIVEANGLTGDNLLQVGDELIIPPNPDAGQ
jgi:nucleoid-associated protein YgaU